MIVDDGDKLMLEECVDRIRSIVGSQYYITVLIHDPDIPGEGYVISDLEPDELLQKIAGSMQVKASNAAARIFLDRSKSLMESRQSPPPTGE